jgi:hypothetical protein
MASRYNKSNYNHVFSLLQDYTLNSDLLEKSVKHFLHETKVKTEVKTEVKTDKKVLREVEIKPVLPSVFFPKEKDSLFWCFYAMIHDIETYQSIEYKNVIMEKKIKIDYVEKLRCEKKKLKQYKCGSLTHIENKLVNEPCIDISTFFALAAIEKINILVVMNRSYYELRCDGKEEEVGDKTFVIVKDNENYGYEHDASDDKIKQYRDTLYQIKNIDKPVKSISAYTSDELKDICDKLHITLEKKVTKKVMYEEIVKFIGC